MREPAPGATERFGALFDAHYSALVAYARRRCPSPADADDLVAEVFTVAWRRLDGVPVGGAARLWLYGVARRCLANQRRGDRRRLRLVERAGAALAADQGDQGDRGDRGDPGGEQAEHLRAALGRLREDDREILKLVAWEGLAHADVAAVLGISANAVGIRLHRARRRLAGALKDEASAGQVRGEAPEDGR